MVKRINEYTKIEQNLTSNSTTAAPSVAAVVNAINNIAVNDANIVHKTGDENIAGNKTFTNNVKANSFIGDGSQLTNLTLPAAPTIEQNLTSNSTTSIPSVFAVNSANGVIKFTPAAIKQAVSSASFENGQIYGTQPTGSLPNMFFSDFNYMYHFTFSAQDVDGTNYCWIKLVKSPN